MKCGKVQIVLIKFWVAALKHLHLVTCWLTPRFPVCITQFVAKNVSMGLVNEITVTFLLQLSSYDTISKFIFKTIAQELNPA